MKLPKTIIIDVIVWYVVLMQLYYHIKYRKNR